MFIHHQYKTPLKKNTQTISYDSSSHETHQQIKEKNHQRQLINQLFHNFTNLSNTVDIDLTKNHFNLIEYGKEDQKIKYDSQIMNAKLKRLQNQAEINRIEFELQQRNKKKTRSNYHRRFSNHNPFQNSTYQENYQSFLKNNQLIEIPQNDSQSEQDQKNIQQKPKGISRFNQLKKHSKILQYTIKKIQQREEQTIKQQKSTDQRKQKIKNMTNQLKDYGQFTDVILTKKSLFSTPKTTELNPETIVEDKFKRIMTMKANDKISEKVKMNPRCERMMNLQNQILIELQEEKKSLSKDNMKKLKSRFVQIVNQLHKGDKKRKENKLLLPSIESMTLSVQNSARTAPVNRTTSLISKTIDTKSSFGNHCYQN